MFTRRDFLATASGAAVSLAGPASASPASYFNARQHDALLRHPGQIRGLWASDGARFRASLGPGFAREIDEHVQLAFCAMVACDLKPYGPCHTAELAGMLRAPTLACDNYLALAWRLFHILAPSHTTKIAAVGWDGGAVGNHCQIFCGKAAAADGQGGRAWMIDPTVAVFQCSSDFDAICSGRPASADYRADLYPRLGSVTDQLHDEVVTALADGLYRPSHLLYYFTDLNAYSNPPPEKSWPTPQAAIKA